MITRETILDELQYLTSKKAALHYAPLIERLLPHCDLTRTVESRIAICYHALSNDMNVDRATLTPAQQKAFDVYAALLERAKG